jgi:hypothetical protein
MQPNKAPQFVGLFLFKQKQLLRSSKKRGAGILWLCHKDKTDFTRFLSVLVLFATKKHRFQKKLSTPAVLLPNHLFTGFCLSFSLLFPSFLEPLYKQAFQRIGRGFFSVFFGEASCRILGFCFGVLEGCFLLLLGGCSWG